MSRPSAGGAIRGAPCTTRIIVPIDEDATGVLDRARPLARELGCELTLLHVHHPQEAPAELEGLTQYRYQGVVESRDDRDRWTSWPW